MFHVEFSRNAEKELARLDKALVRRILEKTERLAENPFPPEALKVKGQGDIFRVRVGKYRILYEVHAKETTALIVRIAKRDSAYQ